MESDLIELGKRAVACKGWRWMPGMLSDEGLRVVSVSEEHRYLHVHPGSLLLPTQGYAIPDLQDPATLGCVLALVREAWGDSEMHMTLGAKGWVWLTGESRVYGVVMPINAGDTEAEALVAALEAAP